MNCPICGTPLPEFRDTRIGPPPPGVIPGPGGFWEEVSHGYCPNGCNPHLKIELDQPE